MGWAIDEASLYTALLLEIHWANLEKGPWESSDFFHQMTAQAARLVQLMDENHPLLLRFWDEMLRDAGHHRSTDDAIVGAPARRKYLETLLARKSVNSTGTRVAISKWNTWQQSMLSRDDDRHSKGLQAAAVIMNRGLCSASEDLFGVEVVRCAHAADANVGTADKKKDAKGACFSFVSLRGL